MQAIIAPQTVRWTRVAGVMVVLALWLMGWATAYGYGGGWPSSQSLGLVGTGDTDQGVAMSGVSDSHLNMRLGSAPANPDLGTTLMATALRTVVAIAIVITVLQHFNAITAILGVVGFVVISALIDVAVS